MHACQLACDFTWTCVLCLCCCLSLAENLKKEKKKRKREKEEHDFHCAVKKLKMFRFQIKIGNRTSFKIRKIPGMI